METKNINIQDKVSIILAVYNEEEVIADTIHSLFNQDTTGFEIELLVIDGKSDDRTSVIIKELEREYKGRVNYILNEARITPVAFNLGIKEATGNYISILGAHCEYATNYLKACLQEIKEQGVDACSGKVYPKINNPDAESELCLNIMSSPIGVSSSSFRTRGVGLSDTIPYGIFKKEIFDKVGFYNEKLIRNQDNDMNNRLIKAGFQLYITDKTYCYYFPRKRLKALNNYAYKSGFWNAKSIRMGSFTLKLMHFIPFFFLLYNIFLMAYIFMSLILQQAYIYLPIISPLILYFFVTGCYSVKCKFNFTSNYFLFTFIAVYRFHLNYGFGTLKGFITTK